MLKIWSIVGASNALLKLPLLHKSNFGISKESVLVFPINLEFTVVQLAWSLKLGLSRPLRSKGLTLQNM
jgi:hypothetical protein